MVGELPQEFDSFVASHTVDIRMEDDGGSRNLIFATERVLTFHNVQYQFFVRLGRIVATIVSLEDDSNSLFQVV